MGTSGLASPRASNVRHATGRTDPAGSESVFEESARHALEVVPSLERLHPADDSVKIDQGTIAIGTTEVGRSDIGIAGDDRRSGRTSFPSMRRARFLAHAVERATVSPFRDRATACI